MRSFLLPARQHRSKYAIERHNTDELLFGEAPHGRERPAQRSEGLAGIHLASGAVWEALSGQAIGHVGAWSGTLHNALRPGT